MKLRFLNILVLVSVLVIGDIYSMIDVELCCPTGYIFDPETHECLESENVLESVPKVTYQSGLLICELQKYENVTFGCHEQLAYDNSSDTVTVNSEKLPPFSCLGYDEEEKWHLATYPRIQKCCDNGTILNTNTDTCVDIEGFSQNGFNITYFDHTYDKATYDSFPEGDFKTIVQKSECGSVPPVYVIRSEEKPWNFVVSYVEFELINTEKNSVFQKVFKKEEYCLAVNQEGASVARVCHDQQICQKKTCVKKCCQPGMVLGEDAGKCVAAGDVESLNFTVLNINGEAVSGNTTYEELFSGVPECSLYNPEYLMPQAFDADDDEMHWILPNGSLYSSETEMVYDHYCSDTTISLKPPRILTLYCAENTGSPMETVNVVYAALMTLSSIFLLIIVIIHLMLRELRTLPGITITCHSGVLFVSFLGIAILRLKNYNLPGSFCYIFGFAVHYCLIASFSWLTTMGFDFFWTFSGIRSLRGHNKQSQELKKLCYYSVFAWGLPGIITLTAVAINFSAETSTFSPYLVEGFCWFQGDEALLTYIHGPIAILLTANAIFFITTALKLYSASRGTSNLTPNDRKRANERLYAILKLFVLMGLTWFLEILSHALNNIPIQIALDVVNIFCPVLVFFIVVWKRRVLDLLGLRYFFIGDILRRWGWTPITRGSTYGSSGSKCARAGRSSLVRQQSETIMSQHSMQSSPGIEEQRFSFSDKNTAL